MHSYHYQIYPMIGCGPQKLDSGGKMKASARFLTTLHVTQRNQKWESSWQSGNHYMTPSQVNVEFSTDSLLKSKSKDLDEETQATNLEPIRVPRLSYGTTSSATLQKWLYDPMTVKMTYNVKLDSHRSLEPGNQP